MRFIINSQVLLKSLQAVGGVISSNQAVPILSNFLFKLEGFQLSILASDLETTMVSSVELTEVTEEGEVAIPSKILMDTLKTFPDIPLIFHVNKENYAIEISAGEGKYKLVGLDPQGFPELPQKDETTVKTVLSASVLWNAINKTIFAAGNDSLRQVMTGIYFDINPDSLTVVATDAHKLVRYRCLESNAESAANFIVPKKTLSQVKGILSGKKEEVPVQLEYNKETAFISIDNVLIICRLLDGKYPPYESIIPKENPNKLIVDRLSFLNSIRRISIFGSQSAPQARLKMNGRELIISTEDLDYSNEAKERLQCNYEGEPMEIGFNARFLFEMLNNIDSEEVCLELSMPNRAGLLAPISIDPNEKEEILMLLMPLMLNQ